MPRSLSYNALRALFAQETEEIFLLLATIIHPGLTEPGRIVNNSEDIFSRGNLFKALFFDVALPEETGDTFNETTITIDNVPLTFVQALRSTTDRAQCILELVLASNPPTYSSGIRVADTLEMAISYLDLFNVSWDAGIMTGTLSVKNVWNTALPGDVYDPVQFPGIF